MVQSHRPFLRFVPVSRIRGFNNGFLPSDPQVSSGPYSKPGFVRRAEASWSSTVPQKSRRLSSSLTDQLCLAETFKVLDNDMTASKILKILDTGKYIYSE